MGSSCPILTSKKTKQRPTRRSREHTVRCSRVFLLPFPMLTSSLFSGRAFSPPIVESVNSPRTPETPYNQENRGPAMFPIPPLSFCCKISPFTQFFSPADEDHLLFQGGRPGERRPPRPPPPQFWQRAPAPAPARHGMAKQKATGQGGDDFCRRSLVWTPDHVKVVPPSSPYLFSPRVSRFPALNPL